MARHHPFLHLIAIAVSVLLCTAGCRPQRMTRSFYAMGGIPVTISATGLSAPVMDRSLESARQSVERWESELSMYRPDSTVNQLMNGQPVTFSDRGWEALLKAREAEIVTHRAFDITVGPIIRLWKEAERRNREPDPQEIARALSISGFERLQFDERTKTVGIGNGGGETEDSGPSRILIDVGGIAKGLFAEWICRDILAGLSGSEAADLRKLVIDVGGDVFVHSVSDRYPCEIGVRNPFSSNPGELWGKVRLPEGSIVTSGTYERAFEVNGRRYCHIVNPQTGYPIETDMVSVTIVDPSGAMADALATAVFVLGENAGRSLIESRDGTEILIIRTDGSWIASDGLSRNLSVFEK